MRAWIIAMGAVMAMAIAARGQVSRADYVQHYANSEMQLTLVAPRIVRVRVVPKGANADFPRVRIVLPQPTLRTDRFAIHEDVDFVYLNSHEIHVRISRSDPKVDFLDSAGRIISAGDGGVKAAGNEIGESRAIQDDEQFFGFGLQFHSFAQRGKTKMLKVNADPRDDLGNSHAVVPFFLSTRGYGIFLDSHAYTNFDLGKADPHLLSFRTPDPVLDYYFCYGPSFHDLLARYTQLTGRMPMPPKWGLGFWYRMKSDWKSDKVEEVAAAFRDRHIPCDVIGLEPAWQTHAYSCSYLWSKATYPDPPAFVAWMRQRNFHVNLWEHAYVHPTSPIHEPLAEAGLVADKEVWGGLVPDFTMPEARKLFADLHEKEHISLGVDGYKLDECDGSDFTGGWFFPDDTKFPSGITGAQMHNVFGLLYQKSFHEMFDKQNKRTYLLCRGMFASAQAYPSVIYSDWYGFEQYVRAAANSGFSGVLWCPEIRQTDNQDEFVRRFQTVFFSPLAMINAWADGVTPWEKGPEVEKIFRQYDELRMQLAPYLYNSFRKMNETGLPVVRALVMDWQDDPKTYNVDDAFLYGDAFLVAPVLKGDSRSIYLPKGDWYDWWTGEKRAGSVTIEYTAPLERLPLFVRAGSIIPMQPSMDHAGAAPVDILTLRVYPGPAASTTLYDDDGETLDYNKGRLVTAPVTCTSSREEILLKIGRPTGSLTPVWKQIRWELRDVAEPATVLLSGRPLAPGTGYQYDAPTRTLTVSAPFGAQTLRIRLTNK